MGGANVKVAILGASGRMGQALLDALRLSADLELSGALVRPDNAQIGQDAGSGLGWCSGVEYSAELPKVLSLADVAIDVTLPVVTADIIGACRLSRCPLVVGTSGLSDEHPAGTQSGRVFRLRGKGAAPVRGGPAGDLFCKVKLETPVNLTDEQQELVRELEKSLKAGGKRHHPRSRSWLESSEIPRKRIAG